MSEQDGADIATVALTTFQNVYVDMNPAWRAYASASRVYQGRATDMAPADVYPVGSAYYAIDDRTVHIALPGRWMMTWSGAIDDERYAAWTERMAPHWWRARHGLPW